jgi:hypothetical protein
MITNGQQKVEEKQAAACSGVGYHLFAMTGEKN